MQSKIFILLAVFSHLVFAGLVRHNGRLVRSGKYIRSLNQSSVSVTISQSQTFITTASPSLAANLPVKAASETSTASATASKQIGSVPAFADGPGAASIESSLATTSSSTTSATIVPLLTPSSLSVVTSVKPHSSGSSIVSASTSKQIGSVPAFGSGPGAASEQLESLTSSTTTSFSRIFTLGTGIGNQNPTTTTPSEPQPTPLLRPSTTNPASSSITSSESGFTSDQTLSSTTNAPNTAASSNIVATQSTGTSSAASLLTESTLNTTRAPSSIESTASTTKSLSPPTSTGQPSPPAITEIPNAQNGNIAMALGFNAIFETLTSDSTCDASNSNQASACINEESAQCGKDGKYILTACPQAQKCFALPLQAAKAGITIQCATPQDANAQLGLGTPSEASSRSPKPSISNSGSSLQTLPPQTSSATQEVSIAAETSESLRKTSGPTQVTATFPVESTTAQTVSPPSSTTVTVGPSTSVAAPTVSADPVLPEAHSTQVSLATTATDSPMIVISFPTTSSSISSLQSIQPLQSTKTNALFAVPTSSGVSTPTPTPTADGSGTTVAPLGGTDAVTITETVTVTTTAH